YREHVDRGMEQLLEKVQEGELDPRAVSEVLERTELGVNHEEQHQELLLTDILNAFFTNPLRPAFRPAEEDEGPGGAPALNFQAYPGGLCEVGHDGSTHSFDNERPRHRVWLEPYSVATRLVTCAEYAAFIADGGYRRADLWLSA